LENASSIAGMVLTTECVISEKPSKESSSPSMPHGGGMPGMM
jgi:chaperonin GroEL